MTNKLPCPLCGDKLDFIYLGRHDEERRCVGEIDKTCILADRYRPLADIKKIYSKLRERQDLGRELEKSMRRRKLKRVIHEEENALNERISELNKFDYFDSFANIQRKMEEEI